VAVKTVHRERIGPAAVVAHVEMSVAEARAVAATVDVRAGALAVTVDAVPVIAAVKVRPRSISRS
jgi:hypothetical protein